MTERRSRRWNYAVIIPLLILLALAVFYLHAEPQIDAALLDSKCVEIQNEVDMLAAGVDADPEQPWFAHGPNLRAMVAYLDERPLVFAAAYMRIEENYERITKRDNATTFDPLQEAELLNAFNEDDSGWMVVGFTPDGGEYRDMHVYWRWMPMYSLEGEGYLVVAAVSRLSITVQIATWVVSAPRAAIVVSILAVMWAAVLIINSGYIRSMRTGKQKWRSFEGRR